MYSMKLGSSWHKRNGFKPILITGKNIVKVTQKSAPVRYCKDREKVLSDQWVIYDLSIIWSYLRVKASFRAVLMDFYTFLDKKEVPIILSLIYPSDIADVTAEHNIQTWSLLTAILFCLIFQAWWIVPYTRIFPVEVKSAKHSDVQNTIGILIANVLTTNRNSETLIELILENKPDVFVTLESDDQRIA